MGQGQDPAGTAHADMRGCHLRAIRAALRWSVTDLAAASKMHPAAIQDFENGAELPAASLAVILEAVEMAAVTITRQDGRLRILFPSAR